MQEDDGICVLLCEAMMVDMRKKSDQKRRLGNGERSLKKMLDILDAFAPKEVGTIKPHTG